MTDAEWLAEQPWQRARRLNVPPVIAGRRVSYRPYQDYTGTVLEQSEDGKRVMVDWDEGGVSWVGAKLLEEVK